MPNLPIRIADGPIYRGMNTVDDAKRLKPGECVRLLNLFPGKPPIPRTGCPGVYLSFETVFDRFLPPAIVYQFENDSNIYTIAWVYNYTANKFSLVIFKSDGTGSITSLGYGFQDRLKFTMLPIFSNVYCLISKELLYWGVYTYALGHKVIESATIVRDMCISVVADMQAITQATGGAFFKDDCFDYSFQYVRRNDQAAFDPTGATPTGMILPPAISGRPQRINTFLPGTCIGIEDSTKRQSVKITTDGNGVDICISPVVGTDWDKAMAQGATHLRVCRSSRQATEELAEGATHYFLCDLPVGTLSYGTTFLDSTSDAALVGGEANQLLTGYSVAPAAGYGKYFKGRLFLLADNGVVYYSEVPGGGGGAVDLELAEQYPNAWASLFKPTEYFIDLDQDSYSRPAGVEILGNDIYFFLENRIYVLYGGDPTAATVTKLESEEGCPFPATISHIKFRGKDTLFFLGTTGPKIIEEGGSIRNFSEFKIKELWPDKSTELYADLLTDWNWITENCNAFYFDNTIWVIYQNTSEVMRIWGYHINPDDPDIEGSLEVTFGLSNVMTRIPVKNTIENKAYLLGSSRQSSYVDFEIQDTVDDPDEWTDTVDNVNEVMTIGRL